MSYRIPILLNKFNIGIISQEAYGRIDSDYYMSALAEAKNTVITPYGNIKKRAGTRYVANITCNNIRFIPFIYSRYQSYVLLLCAGHNNTSGDNRMYFLTNGGFVVDGSNNPYYIAIDYSDNLDSIQYAQKDDIMYLACSEHPVKKLIRHAEDNWTIADVDFKTDFIAMYGDGAKADVEVKLPPKFVSAGNVKVTYTIGGTAYTKTDDGSGKFPTGDHISSTNSIDYDTGRLYIKFDTAIDENEPVKVHFFDFSNPYPSVLTFFENRLILANFSNHFQTIWGSQSAVYEDLSVDVTAQSGYMYTVASKQNNAIMWLNDLSKLAIGTAGSEFIANGGDNGITPTNISITKQSSIGSANIQPISIDNHSIYIQHHNSRVYIMAYDYMSDVYKSQDLTLLNDDILREGVTEMVYQRLPYSRIWFLTKEGNIKILTYNLSLKSVSWQDVVTDGKFKTICSIPDNILGFDRIYAVVERNGKQYIEMFDSDKTDGYFDSFYVDCGGEYYDSTTKTDTIDVTGIYDNGTELAILTDIGIHPNVVVADNKIKLQWEANRVVYGLPYETKIKTLPVEMYGNGISSIDIPKKISNLNIKLLDSMGGEIGIEGATDTLYYRLLSYPTDRLLDLYTGTKEIVFNKGFDKETSIVIKHNEPTPFNILYINFMLEM